jgi:hypothetical protein
VRAGKNRPYILNLIKGTSKKSFKAAAQEVVLFEAESEAIFPGAGSILGSAVYTTVYNDTGVALNVTAVYKDADGNERVLETATVLAAPGSSFDFGSLSNTQVSYLELGEKLILRFVESVAVGNGVRVIRQASQYVPFAFDTKTTKITGTVIEAKNTVGTVPLGSSLVLLNMTPNAINYTSFLVFEADGFEVPVAGGSGTLPVSGATAGGVGVNAPNAGPGLLFRVKLAVAPVGGYVVAKQAEALVTNLFDTTPA